MKKNLMKKKHPMKRMLMLRRKWFLGVKLPLETIEGIPLEIHCHCGWARAAFPLAEVILSKSMWLNTDPTPKSNQESIRNQLLAIDRSGIRTDTLAHQQTQ